MRNGVENEERQAVTLLQQNNDMPKFIYCKNWLGRVIHIHNDGSVTAEFNSPIENAPCYLIRVWKGEWKDAETKV